MATKAGEAYVELTLRGRRAVSATLGAVEARLKKFGSMVRSFGAMAAKGVAIGASAAAAGIGAGLALAVKNASDMQETMNKFNVVMGESAGAMKQWSDETAQAFGRSKQQTADFTAAYQDLLVPMGVAPDQAMEMSKAMTALTFDLGSFNNKADPQVHRDLMAALAGSGEVMKKYGSILTVAAVKQELMNQGLDPNAATDAQKAMARMNIILQDTTAAQGDVGRSSMSFANQVKAMKAQFSDLFMEIGMQVIPILESFMINLRAAVNVIGKLAGASVQAGGDLEAVKDVFSDMTGPIEFIIRGFSFWMGSIRMLQSALTFLGVVLADVVRLAADAASWIPGSFGDAAEDVADIAEAIRNDLYVKSGEQFELGKQSFATAFGDDVGRMLADERKKMEGLQNKAAEASATLINPVTNFGESAKKVEKAAEKISQIKDAGIATANRGAFSATMDIQRKTLQRQQEALDEQKKSNELLQQVVDKEPVVVEEVSI